MDNEQCPGCGLPGVTSNARLGELTDRIAALEQENAERARLLECVLQRASEYLQTLRQDYRDRLREAVRAVREYDEAKGGKADG